MKQKFSTAWKASKQPRKQRKYAANAPIHLKKKLMSSNLSKELRKKYDRRSLTIRKGDTIKIMRGKFKKKKGKVLMVDLKAQRVEAEGIQIKKQDGSKINFPLKASNLQIIELNLEDKKRNKIFGKVIKTKEKEKDKTNDKEPDQKSKESGVKDNAPKKKNSA